MGSDTTLGEAGGVPFGTESAFSEGGGAVDLSGYAELDDLTALETELQDYANDAATNAQEAAQDYADGPAQFGTERTDSFTFELNDAQKIVKANKATALTGTVPLNSVVAFPIGTVIQALQTGAGQLTIAATGGVTFRTPSGLIVEVQYGSAYLLKIGTDEWVVSADADAVLESLADAKGDLFVASAANTIARLGVEDDGDVLTLDSAEALGMKWAPPAAATVTTAYGRVSGADFTTASNVFGNLTGLSIAVGANQVWAFDVWLSGQCSTASGSQFAINGPVGATLEAGAVLSNTSDTTHEYTRLSALDGASKAGWGQIATDLYARITGTMATAGNAGTLAVRARSNTNLDTTTVRIGSVIVAHRIS